MVDSEQNSESGFHSFRPYETKDTLPQPKGSNSNNLQINVGNTRIVFQNTPPPPKRPLQQKKPIPRVQSWTPPNPTSSMSQASAVGTTAVSSTRPHQLVAENLRTSARPALRVTSTDSHWMPDKLCHQCSECEIKFGIFVRRHHCRICGRIFCNSCTSNTVLGSSLQPPMPGKVRVCTACLTLFNERNMDSSTAESQPLPLNTTPTRGRSNSVTSMENQGSPEMEAMSFNPSVMLSWDDRTLPDADLVASPSRVSGLSTIEFDNPTPLRPGSTRRSSKDESVLALAEDEIDIRLQEIWSKFTHSTYGLTPQSRRHRFGIRTFQNAYVAQEIVDWLVQNGHAYSREMAVRIGTAFIDTKFLRVVSSADQVFKDSKDIILEIGEVGYAPLLDPKPTVMDAPNWFLSDEGDDLIAHNLSNRPSLGEANLDVQSGSVTFRLQPDSSMTKVQPNHSELGISPPEILTIEETEEKKEHEYESEVSSDNTETYFVQNYFSSDTTTKPNKENYLLPPQMLSPAQSSSSSGSLNPSMISYSVLTPGSVLKAFPVTQTAHFAHEFEGSSVQSKLNQDHTLHHQTHLELCLAQQLMSFGVSLSWLEIIQPLILEASQKVRTNLTPDDFMDISCYCKIKKIPGGRRSACNFVYGVVFSKHVTHKKMDLSLRNPRVLLLKCALEFQRKESQLSSFDTLMLQEQEYLKNLIERIKKFQPHIILVQKSVARFALEMLHHHRIVVVVNVKPSVMSRVARSTQGDLLSSLDQLHFNVKLGTCGNFYVRTFTLPDGIRKTLMYFDNCEPKLGGVIILQGAEVQELKKVKKVVQFGLQVAHNMRLESAFLTDEFAVPQSPLMDLHEHVKGYDTPSASPELQLYPFSSSMFDESVMRLEEEAEVKEESSEKISDILENVQPGLASTDDSFAVLSDTPNGESEEQGATDHSEDNSEDESLGISQEQLPPEEEHQLQDNEEEEEEAHRAPDCSPPSSELVFKEVLGTHLISTSPHVRFTVPYLQTDQGINADVKKYLPEVLYWSNWFKPRVFHDIKGPGGTNWLHSYSSGKVSLQSSLHESNQRKYTYKSVSSHPFVNATFLLPANSNEVKSALADFRARASLPDEPNCFFFPSARNATNVSTQLQKIFAKSKEFESKAEYYHKQWIESIKPPSVQIKDEDMTDQGSQTTELSKRTTRWVVPEKENYKPSNLVRKPEPSCFLTPDPVIEEQPEKNQTDGLSKMLELGRISPEPRLVSSNDNQEHLTPSSDWSILADEQMPPNEQLDCLDPFNHQFISLVFSSTCHDKMKHLYPCVFPCIIPMNYYGRNDISLGEFLHRYCFRDFYVCQSCNVDMASHQRHFVHGTMELRISMQQLAASIPGGDKKIFTWCSCNDCAHQSTPLVPLSEDALLYSFAKFLELKFYGSSYLCYNFQSGLPPSCIHPIHSYTQFFSFQDKVATFELFPVNIFEVRVPPPEIYLDSLHIVHHDYLAEISHLSKMIESVFHHIKQYIEVYSIEPVQIMAKDCMDRCLGMRENLRMKVKRLKDLSVSCGVSQGQSLPVNNTEDYYVLQDSIAELKRNLADTVDWFNKDIYVVDCKLREFIGKKDPSPRDTPLTTTVGSDSGSTPKQSPQLHHKSTENNWKGNMPVPEWEEKSTNGGLKPGTFGHRRQLSDSVTFQHRNEATTSKEREQNQTVTLRERTGSDGKLYTPVFEDSTHSDQRASGRARFIVESTAQSEREGELVEALRESMSSEEVMSIVYSEDIMTKIRGKGIEDPTKFYYLRSTPIVSSNSHSTESKSSLPLKKSPTSPVVPKTDEPDSAFNSSGLKSKFANDKITNLLSKPFQKLPLPFEPTEHHLLRGRLRFQVSVYENEPTSIIAFALCSREYAHELKLLLDEERRVGLSESVASVVSKNFDGEAPGNASNSKTSGFIKNVISEIRKKKPQSSSHSASGEYTLPPECQDSSDPFEELCQPSDNMSTIKWNGSSDSSDKFSSSHEKRHISLEFADDTTKFFCKVYYAEEFRKLREAIHPEGDDSFIRSLARCVRYDAKGGKSRAMFLKTFEDRLIMKQVQLVEITSFIEIATQYFQHVSDAITKKRPMVLAKILGAYSIGFKNTRTNRSHRHHVIIMENLLYRHNCTKVFDLKGSMRGRYVTTDPKKEKKGDVLMDENFLEYVYNCPVYVWPHSKAILMQAIIADTHFLSKNHIMDYSLLAGLDQEKGELVVGIIDFVRPFTLDKRLEFMVKKAGRSVLPTVVYPDLYRKRFLDAMERYFTPIPDKWTGLGADIRVNF